MNLFKWFKPGSKMSISPLYDESTFYHMLIEDLLIRSSCAILFYLNKGIKKRSRNITNQVDKDIAGVTSVLLKILLTINLRINQETKAKIMAGIKNITPWKIDLPKSKSLAAIPFLALIIGIVKDQSITQSIIALFCIL